MFDIIAISKELIGEDEDFIGQAKDKDLGCAMNSFTINREGVIEKLWIRNPDRFLPFNYHGKFDVYNITGFYHDASRVKTTYTLEYYMGDYVGFTKTIV